EIVLRHGPIERHALAGPFGEGCAIGSDGLLEPGGAALAFAKHLERASEIVLRHGPIERHALARSQLCDAPLSLGCEAQSPIAADLIPLPIESVGLPVEVVPVLILHGVALRKKRGRLREELCRLRVSQLRHCNIAALA